MLQDKLVGSAVKVGVGAVAGVVSGLKNNPAPHVGRGLATASSNFANGVTKALRRHQGVGGAIGAGAAAVIGHGAVAAAVVAAAPAVLATAAAGGAVFGVYKLVEYIRDEW
jgi:hypothetical protein